MKKLYLKSTGEEVNLGDTLVYKDKLGGITTLFRYPLNEKLRDVLLKMGVLVLKDIKENTSNMTPQSDDAVNICVMRISKRLGWKTEKTERILDTIKDINISALFSILAKEIAVEIDKKYKDHITESPKIYVINTMDGRITEANKAHIKNYRNFAAFRTVEDAKEACRILSPILKYMFKSDRK